MLTCFAHLIGLNLVLKQSVNHTSWHILKDSHLEPEFQDFTATASFNRNEVATSRASGAEFWRQC